MTITDWLNHIQSAHVLLFKIAEELKFIWYTVYFLQYINEIE